MDDSDGMHGIGEMGSPAPNEPEFAGHVPTPADHLPRLPPRPSPVAPSMPASSVALDEPVVSVVVDTPPRQRRRGLRGGIAAGVALVLVAVGSFIWKLDDPAPGYSLTAAVGATEKVDSIRFEMDIDAAGQAIPVKGVLDVKSRIMQMELDASLIPGAPAGAKLTAYMDLNNLVMYMGGEVLGGQLPSGKKWILLDMKALAGANGADLGALTQGPTNDPLSAVALAGQAKKTTDIGRETVLDGVAAEHFQFEVNTDDALKAAGTTRARVIGDSGAKLPDAVVYDVWVDANNHIRQMKFELSIADQSLKYAVRYTQINPEVHIVLPTKDESVDILDLTGA